MNKSCKFSNHLINTRQDFKYKFPYNKMYWKSQLKNKIPNVCNTFLCEYDKISIHLQPNSVNTKNKIKQLRQD